MQFRTELHIPESEQKISIGSKLLTLGSCFSDVIGQRLHNNKIDTLVNPFGTIFNPISQFELIEAALLPHEQEELPMVERDGRWYAYGFHSSFSGDTREELQTQIDEMLQLVKIHLLETNVVFFTFGTALVYQLSASDRIVANCHKMPRQDFNRRLLLTEEIVSGFAQAFSLLRQHNPNIRAVLTVSPVRHLKETLPLNTVSKSVLRLACHYLAELMPEVEYFPAYELLIDDLRDYRFYKDDLLHPSPMAEQYVWEKFSEAYFDINLKNFTREWQDIRQAMLHKPFNPGSLTHQNFLNLLLARLEKVNATVNCAPEIAFVKKQFEPVKAKKAAKKAPQELVELLTMLAASDIMIEEDAAADFYAAEAKKTAATAQTPQPDNEPALEDSFAETEQPAAETPEAEDPKPAEQVRNGRPEKVSKSKKRRDKRKAKKIADRDNQPKSETTAQPENNADQVAAANPETTQTTEPAQDATPLPPNKAAADPAPVKAKRGRKKKAEVTKKEAELPKAQAPEPAPEKTGEITPSPEIEAKPAVTVKRGRKPGKTAKLRQGNQLPAASPKSKAPAPEKQSEPPQNSASGSSISAEAIDKTEKKKPGRKPALGVGALLSALAGVQNSKGAKPGRPKKAEAKPEAAKPEKAPASAEKPAIAKKPGRKATPKNKPNPAAPELPFTPEPPAANQEQGPAKAGQEPKQKDSRKDNGGPKKGKAKRIVLKKAAPKNNN